MKQRLSRIVFAALALGMTGLAFTQTGCSAPFGSTPVFSSEERFARISRNINLESQMINDDIDHILLLRPVSGLTVWNVP